MCEIMNTYIQLPGRGKHNSPYLKSLSEVGEQLAPILLSRLNKADGTGGVVPWAVLGHSMGCWAAYETVKALESLGCSTPPTTFIAACFASPDIKERPWTPNASLNEVYKKTQAITHFHTYLFVFCLPLLSFEKLFVS
jgi:surfactin synthase thioesterase subunit